MNGNWVNRLYRTILGEDGKELNERAESVFLEVFQILTPCEEKIILLRYKENKTLDEVGREFNITRDRVKEIESIALIKLRRPGNIYYIRRQGIFVGQDGPLPDPVATEEQKEFILHLAKEKGISKDKANRGFIHTCIRENSDSVIAEADYGVISELIKYLEETL